MANEGILGSSVYETHDYAVALTYLDWDVRQMDTFYECPVCKEKYGSGELSAEGVKEKFKCRRCGQELIYRFK